MPEKASGGAETPLERDIEPVRHYRISPDERSIYAEFKCYTRRSSCELFARKKGFQFTKVFTRSDDDGGNFDAAMWKFFARTTGLEHAEYPRLCDFVAWAPDSSRLLVALRGVATPKRWKPDPDAEIESAPGVYGWKVYWNTRKHAFELTKMLKEDNKQAAKRWTDGGEGPDVARTFLRRTTWGRCRRSRSSTASSPNFKRKSSRRGRRRLHPNGSKAASCQMQTRAPGRKSKTPRQPGDTRAWPGWNLPPRALRNAGQRRNVSNGAGWDCSVDSKSFAKKCAAVGHGPSDGARVFPAL